MKVLAITQDQEIVCIEVWDKQYIWQRAFPKEKTYALLDNLAYIQTVLVKKKDTFEVFTTPTQADSGSSHSKQAFTYDTLKLTTRSQFKLASAN